MSDYKGALFPKPKRKKRKRHSADPSGVEERDRLRAETERKYIEDLMTDGCTLDEAVEAWMQFIGKNYCEEINP